MKKVSIILAVKNETEKLIAAVNDLLNQTYKNIELIISDDASSNNETVSVINGFSDERIVKIFHKKHQGLSNIKNHAISISTGEYIAIADADDRYHSKRIELQVAFLEKTTHIDFCGTNILVQGKNYGWNNFIHHSEIYWQFLITNPFVHPSIMFRRKLVNLGFQYNSKYDYAEDYLLFSSLRKGIKMANLPEALVYYNNSPKHGILKTLSENQQQLKDIIRQKILVEEINNVDEKFSDLHRAICELNNDVTAFQLIEWFNFLLINSKNKYNRSLRKVLLFRIYLHPSRRQIPFTFRLINVIYFPFGLNFKCKFLINK